MKIKYLKKILLFITLLVSIKVFSQTNKFRPIYHFTPAKNWVNDPNGLVYLDGEYHLFFQYNPLGDVWGHMSWGHAVSTDLKTWKELPLALPETLNPDGSANMVFSGCAIVDSLNTSGLFNIGFKKGLVAIYTSHIEKYGKGQAQHQSIAFSSDKGRTWQFYKENPVLDIGLKDFRDPNVIWWTETQSWIMTVVKPLEFKVQFYSSKNLKTWTLNGEWGKMGDTTKIWECPSLTRIPVEGKNMYKWLLMVSSGHEISGYLGVQYFVGDFDGYTFRPQIQDKAFYVDYGKDHYATVPFYNLPKNQTKPIFISWANDWTYARDLPTQPYRGQFTLARKGSLYLDENQIYKLKQEPIINEKIPVFSQTLSSFQNLNKAISQIKPNIYRLKLKLIIGKAQAFNLNLLGEEVVLSFDSKSQELSLDRRNANQIDFHPKFAGISKANVSPENGILNLDIIVDKSIIEVYAQNGKVVITDLIFPANTKNTIGLTWK